MKKQPGLTDWNTPRLKGGKPPLSTANMFALLVNGKFESKIAIPPWKTHEQVIDWLREKQYLADPWKVSGIYEYH